MVHRNNESSPGSSGVLEMRAQLDQEQARLLVVWLPISQLGKAANLLQELHYFHFGGHTLYGRMRPQDTCHSYLLFPPAAQ